MIFNAMGTLLWIWSDWLLYVSTAIYVVAVVIATIIAFLWINAREDERIQDREKKYNSLIDCILNGTITDEYSFNAVYKNFKRNDFDAFVSDFLNYAVGKAKGDDFRKIEEFIKRMEDAKALKDPFEGCIPSDKQYLLSINEVVAGQNNEAANHALRELSRSLKEKDRKLYVQRIINITALVLSGVGIALSVIWGVRGLSDKDVDRIKGATEEVMQSYLKDSIQ